MPRPGGEVAIHQTGGETWPSRHCVGQKMRETTHTAFGLPYLLFTPEGSGDLPLIVFLQGRRESGGGAFSKLSLVKVKQRGPPSLPSEDRLPAVSGTDFRMK